MKKMFRNSAGFTIIEILAVTMLMAGLLGMVGVAINSNVKKGRIRTARAQIANFEKAISVFELECSFYPTNLEDLVSNSSGEKCKDFPKGGFLGKEEIPLDPWSQEYSYKKPGTHNQSTFDLWSSGPDKEDGTDDDITNWKSESSDEESTEE